ncbi:hypothetical protein CAPI_04435 [Corynebacterium capitovis DSM 44611]|uniref:YraN family protein n=1 Tax=Corynebacterium capitovis TaxID=131081 RepID=UPI00036CBEA4|nr:YraN family protein [Corynebacterium capitovis]WKD57445.1 hypothetical protein CAPI_04435 [Corynebacterium capitovis DSM 44611]
MDVEGHTALGVAGENYAAELYRGKGYELVGARVRTPSGEIDIVARAPCGALVFIEVKTRRGLAFGAAEAVTSAKLRRMRRCASEWLAAHNEAGYSELRFDVAEILSVDGGLSARIFEGVEDGSR